MSEKKRGCGYRKIGGLYLVGGGRAVPCDFLPYELTTCRHCGAGVKQTRGFTWLTRAFFGPVACREACRNGPDGTRYDFRGACPLDELPDTKFGLLWIGEKYYPTTEAFTREAASMGISRRLAQIPRELRLGETWVFLAHPRCSIVEPPTPRGDDTPDTISGGNYRLAPAIFYMFRPERIEKILTKDMATEEEAEYCRKRGITPVIVEDLQRHRTGKDDGQFGLQLNNEREVPE